MNAITTFIGSSHIQNLGTKFRQYQAQDDEMAKPNVTTNTKQEQQVKCGIELDTIARQYSRRKEN